MNVYDNDQLMRGRLEEKMLHVAEENVNLAATMVVVAKTIVMDLQLASDALAVKARPSEDIVEIHWLTVWMMLEIRFEHGTKSLTSNNTELVLFNHVF